MASKLEQLRAMSAVVADTGDISAIETFRPIDCTTNPTLVLKAAASPRYAGLITAAMSRAFQRDPDPSSAIASAARQLAVGIGAELATLIPGRVSTEVDARLSFDTAAMEAEGHAIIGEYAKYGVGPDRVLIKLAATWEGIRAAELLQRRGIDTNMTLVFGLEQALACADAGAFLISPFVGRILDWHKQTYNSSFTIDAHPGVVSVRAIHNAYRRHHFDTAIMAASFRSVEEIEALAGCDRLTIAPGLLAKLAEDHGSLVRQLGDVGYEIEPAPPISEVEFRWAINQDAMATAKLAEGIRVFAADLGLLNALLETRWSEFNGQGTDVIKQAARAS